jgi:hypothetical protein
MMSDARAQSNLAVPAVPPSPLDEAIHDTPPPTPLRYAPPQVPSLRESLPPRRAAAWATAYGATALSGMVFVAAADCFWYTAPELPGPRFLDFLYELPHAMVASAVAALVVFFTLRCQLYRLMRGVRRRPLLTAALVGGVQVAIALTLYDAGRSVARPESAILLLATCCCFPVVGGLWLGWRSQ